MSSSSGEEVLVEEVTQEIREQQLVNRFDFFYCLERTTEGSSNSAFYRFWSSEDCRNRSR
jgi:hypothetical protein